MAIPETSLWRFEEKRKLFKKTFEHLKSLRTGLQLDSWIWTAWLGCFELIITNFWSMCITCMVRYINIDFLLCIIMHLLLFFSPAWLAYFLSHDYFFYIIYFYFLFLSDERPTLETLNFTIRFGSTPTFFFSPTNFDFYLYPYYAVH